MLGVKQINSFQNNLCHNTIIAIPKHTYMGKLTNPFQHKRKTNYKVSYIKSTNVLNITTVIGIRFVHLTVRSNVSPRRAIQIINQDLQ